MRHTKTALTWIIAILADLNAPYEIIGGLAAEEYGSLRELADLDFAVPGEYLDKIVPHVKEYLTFGPDWYEDHEWKTYMVSIKYAGQNIDIIAVDKTNIFDSTTDKWVKFPLDLSAVTYMRYLDVELPFMNEDILIDVKEKLGRGVDKKDVRAMEDNLGSGAQ